MTGAEAVTVRHLRVVRGGKAVLRERTGETDLGAAFLATIRAAERSAAT
jgi:hypothetical protein